MSPPATTSGPPEDAVFVEVDRLAEARLVRAATFGYAIWNGSDNVDVFAPDGSQVCWARVDIADLPSISQLMVELLEFTQRLAA